jgi:hypothetical protein
MIRAETSLPSRPEPLPPAADWLLRFCRAIAQADPIFAAMDTHRAAVRTFDLLANRVATREEADDATIIAGLKAYNASGRVLTETAPTTRAGLQTLDQYLREERNWQARSSIEYPHVRNGVVVGRASGIGLVGVDYLIAKRAAELPAACRAGRPFVANVPILQWDLRQTPSSDRRVFCDQALTGLVNFMHTRANTQRMVVRVSILRLRLLTPRTFARTTTYVYV